MSTNAQVFDWAVKSANQKMVFSSHRLNSLDLASKQAVKSNNGTVLPPAHVVKQGAASNRKKQPA